jgi:hypothetical protein
VSEISRNIPPFQAYSDTVPRTRKRPLYVLSNSLFPISLPFDGTQSWLLTLSLNKTYLTAYNTILTLLVLGKQFLWTVSNNERWNQPHSRIRTLESERLAPCPLNTTQDCGTRKVRCYFEWQEYLLPFNWSMTIENENAEANTDMRRLTTGIRSGKCVVWRFRRCTNIMECSYTNLDSTTYYTPSLHISYCSQARNL